MASSYAGAQLAGLPGGQRPELLCQPDIEGDEATHPRLGLLAQADHRILAALVGLPDIQETHRVSGAADHDAVAAEQLAGLGEQRQCIPAVVVLDQVSNDTASMSPSSSSNSMPSHNPSTFSAPSCWP
jgi:hypothetical protein